MMKLVLLKNKTNLSTMAKMAIFACCLVSVQPSFAQTPIAVGPQTATFTSLVRGYYFTAPVSFTICGLYIPDDASSGSQSVEVVKFTAGPPPAYAGTTNSFLNLFYQANWVPNTMIPCSIPITAGDVIGVYGARDAAQINSYSSPNYVSSINANPVTFYRSGMQFSLATSPMHDIWSEVAFSIGRVIMYINCCNAVTPTVVSPVTYCQYQTASALTASGTPNLLWYTTPTGGVGSTTPPTPNTSVPGTTTYYVVGTGTQPSGCESARVPITVVVNAKPATPTISNLQNYCNGTPFAPFNVTGTNLKWYTVPSGGTGSATAPTINTNIPGVYTYYVSQTVLGCESDRLAITETVYPVLTANYTFAIKYGCGTDTVKFTNFSVGTNNYQWDFGDGGSDTAKNPTHIYTTQGIYNVKLKVVSPNCKDSSIQSVDVLHPLSASFTVDDDSVCQFQIVNFTDGSVTTTRNNINPSYFWDFRDGGISNLQSPTHQFTKTGVYNVMMVVTDFVPCRDTSYHLVLVDSVPHAYVTVTDSVVCAGHPISFNVDYLSIGNTGTTWDFGDGTVIHDRGNIIHAYDTEGVYIVKFNASYRICRDTFTQQKVTINPYPAIDLGPDTALCPNAGVIRIADRINLYNPNAQYLWNTGAQVFSILVDSPGVYYATVTIDGCSVTDSVTIHKDCYVNIPNSFTPNDDGLNDYFFPRQLLASGVKKFSMRIFSRWGQIIYETTNPGGRGWDGKFNDKFQPNGVYIYQIEVDFTNGHSEKYTGNVTLLR